MGAVFLDLDGTLVDPKIGITQSVHHALVEMEHPAPEPDALAWVIGPPLLESFTKLGLDDPHTALDHYRAHYTSGAMYQAKLYPGILDGLEKLREAKHSLFLMTAKPHAYARHITAHFGITPYLEAEYGPELDGTRNNKAELLAYALEQQNVDPTDAVMVGDHAMDIRAAVENDVTGIAVTWGYGTEDEFAGAKERLSDPRTLGDDLLRILSS